MPGIDKHVSATELRIYEAAFYGTPPLVHLGLYCALKASQVGAP